MICRRPRISLAYGGAHFWDGGEFESAASVATPLMYQTYFTSEVRWFMLYVAMGGGIGAAIRRPYQTAPSCRPFNSVFGLIQSTCLNEAVNFFWLIVAGIPRPLILFPALAVAMVRAALLGARWHWSSAALWLVYSIPFLLIGAAGATYSRTRHRTIAAVASALILLEIAALGPAM
jgi:hypothetical protein